LQSVGYAALEVIPTFKGIEGKLEAGTSGPLSKAGVIGGGKFGDSAGRSMSSRFVSHAKTAAILAGGVLTGVAAIGIKIGRDAIDEARESQRVGAITARVIKSTGQAANVTAGQVGKLSTAISNRVGIDDEAIQSGANLLLTFKNIQDQAGKGNKVFDQATKVTTDMAVAMAGGNTGGNVDLKSSSILVGKALNDPIKGLTALTRVGVSFTDQQKKNITSLVDQGNIMGAQKIILGELQSEFGGTAAAQATMGDKVTVAWKNIEENIGNGLLPLIDEVEKAFLKKAVPALQDFSNWFQKDGTKKIQGFVNEAKPLAESLLPAVGTGFKDVAGFLKDAAGPAKATINAFNSLPDWAQKAIVLGTAGGLLAKKTGVLSLGTKALTGGSSGGGLLGLVSKAKPLPVFVVNEGAGGIGGGIGGGVANDGRKLSKLETFKKTLPLYSVQGLLVGGIAVEGAEGVNRGIHSITSLGGSGFSTGSVGGPTNPKAPKFALPPVDAGGLTVKEYLQTLKGSATAADALNASLATTSRDLDLVGAKGGKSFQALNHSGGEYKALLDKLPKNVQTAIETPGMVQTQRDVDTLKRKYDLTPKQVRTAFELTGIERARKQIDDLRAHAGRHISASLSIELAGRGPGQAALDGVNR
jgi:hypothetical protein